ncbi:site-specific integrase [Rhodovastum sp. RN2-1]|uniref:Site-specific integrase n=2 Tax=Limobrevibacterium gyesilva TaxID=2991712 RepID=A0AA41YM13_9PROT|nr:site-specific integrase [Limobrevibacterium gyesilva]
MQDGGLRRGAEEDRLGHIPAILGDFIADVVLSKLTSKSVVGFRDRQQSLYAPSTVVKRLNLLATVLNWARKDPWYLPLAVNPASADLVERPSDADAKRDRRLLVVSRAQLRHAAARGEEPPKNEEEYLYDAVARSENKWDIWLVKWAIAQAMRQGESFALRWHDVDLDAKIVTGRGRHNRGTKNAKHRKERGPELRPLMPQAIAVLEAVMPVGGLQPSALVFPAGSQMAFRVRFARLLARARVRHIPAPLKELGYLSDLTYHDLRHESASRLAEIYKNPLDLMRITGHLDLKSLNRYYQPNLIHGSRNLQSPEPIEQRSVAELPPLFVPPVTTFRRQRSPAQPVPFAYPSGECREM